MRRGMEFDEEQERWLVECEHATAHFFFAHEQLMLQTVHKLGMVRTDTDTKSEENLKYNEFERWLYAETDLSDELGATSDAGQQNTSKKPCYYTAKGTVYTQAL
jgi:hypothetical protein